MFGSFSSKHLFYLFRENFHFFILLHISLFVLWSNQREKFGKIKAFCGIYSTKRSYTKKFVGLSKKALLPFLWVFIEMICSILC